MKISKLLKLFPLIFVASLFSAILSLYFAYISMSNEMAITIKLQKYKQLSLDFRDVSEYLSNHANYYVVYKDDYYYDIFQEEVNVLKTRESIIDQLKKLNFDDKELIDEIFNLSNKLVQEEQDIFKIVPQDPKLAVDMIESSLYKASKDELKSKLNTYKDLTNARFIGHVEDAKGDTEELLTTAIIMLLISIVIVTITFYLLYKKMHEINVMVSITSRIAKGDLNINLEQYFSNDEIGELAINFGNLAGTVKGLILDIDHLTTQHDLGNLSVGIDNTKYEGAYRKVSIGLTTMVNSYVTMINEISTTLEEFTKGDFSAPIMQYPGEKASISISTLKLRDNLTNINAEIYNLINAAALGRLWIKANLNTFQGDWRKICSGLNDLLAMIFKKLIDSAPMAYILLSKGQVIEANNYARKNLKISENNPSIRYFDIQDRDDLEKKIDKYGFANGEIIRLINKNGEVRRYNINVCQITHNSESCNVFWGFDVEEEEANTDAIKRAEGDLNKLIDLLPLPLHIIDEETEQIVYGNNSYLELFGFKSLENVIGRSVDILFDEKQTNGLYSMDEYLKYKNSNNSWEFDYINQERKIINAKVTKECILYNDRNSLVEVILDIGAQKRQNEMLENAAVKEREANKLKGRFLINMSHEIRTPMNAVIGLSEIALMKDQSPENLDYFKKINASSKNLLTIINDILDFSKIEAGKLVLEYESFELEAVIANAFMVASELVSKKPIEMLLDMNANVPVSVCGDKVRLWQILKNLLDNAAKYTQKGHIILKVKLSDVQKANSTHLDFTVIDTGLGMTPLQVEKIFNLFERFHTKTSNSGTGLGMSIVRQLTRLMDGEIFIKSEPNIGSEFTIRVGFTGDVGLSIQDSITFDKSNTKNKILLVDDDHHALQIMTNLLNIVDLHPICANGEQAALLAVEQTKFDIIILDYCLGDTTGLELGKKLMEKAKEAKFFMVSAYSRKFLKSEVLEAGFEDIIEKPFVPSAFIHALSRTVNMKAVKQDNYIKFIGTRVLLCEDNEINQEVAKGMLDILGIIPTVVNNGQECVDMVKENQFDLILMDILMPVMNGYEATTKIREINKTLPIIAMTANVIQDEKDNCIKLGMNDYIEKPISFDKLFRTLLRYLPESTHDFSPINTKEVKTSIQIDGVDVNDGLKRFGGKEQNYFSSLQKFAISLHKNPILTCTNFDNLEQIKQNIHALKGVSGNLGVRKLYDLSLNFENSLKNGQQNIDLLAKLKTECLSVQENILHQLKEDPICAELDSGSHDDFIYTLMELELGIRTANPASYQEALTKLKSKIWDRVNKDILSKLYKEIEDYEFEKSAKLIEILKRGK